MSDRIPAQDSFDFGKEADSVTPAEAGESPYRSQEDILAETRARIIKKNKKMGIKPGIQSLHPQMIDGERKRYKNE